MCPECGETIDPNRVRAKWLHRRVSPDRLLVVCVLGGGLAATSNSDYARFGLISSAIITLAP